MATRSAAASDDAVKRAKTALGAAGASADVRPLVLDLSSIASIEAGAAAFMAAEPKLDCLMCNAGVMAQPLATTKDGFEMQFGVNHVGHQHLTTLLLPALAAAGTAEEPARVVCLSSRGNWFFELPEGICFDALPPVLSKYSRWTRYGETKLCNILMAEEVSRRCAAAGQHVIGVSLHPGVILGTKLARHFDLTSTVVMLRSLMARGRTICALTQANKPIPAGASTQLVCALQPGITGGYYADCAPDKVYISKRAGDAALAAKLWEYTATAITDAKSAGARAGKA